MPPTTTFEPPEPPAPPLAFEIYDPAGGASPTSARRPPSPSRTRACPSPAASASATACSASTPASNPPPPPRPRPSASTTTTTSPRRPTSDAAGAGADPGDEPDAYSGLPAGGQGATGVSLLWDTPAGSYLLETTRLPPRPAADGGAYVLNVELARHRLMRLVQKQEDWNLWEVPAAADAVGKARRATATFAESLAKLGDDRPAAAALADQALAAGIRGRRGAGPGPRRAAAVAPPQDRHSPHRLRRPRRHDRRGDRPEFAPPTAGR